VCNFGHTKKHLKMSRYQDDFELSTETRKTVSGIAKDAENSGSTMNADGVLVDVSKVNAPEDCHSDCVSQVPSFLDASLRSRYLFAVSSCSMYDGFHYFSS
jgi:hypothetical protein